MPVEISWPATAEELKAAGYADLRVTRWCHCGPVFDYRAPDGGRVSLVVDGPGDAMEVRYSLHDDASCRFNDQVKIESRGRRSRGRLF